MRSQYLQSRFPPIPDLPEVSTWDFVFRREACLEKVIYVDEGTGEELRFGQLKTLSKQLAHGFRQKLHLQRQSTVIVFACNSLLFPAVVLGTQAAGLICSPANAAYQVGELVHQIRDSGAQTLIVGKDVLSIALSAKKETSVQNIFVMEKEEVDGCPSIWSLVDHEEFEPELLRPEECKKLTCLLCYSSGTSGLPKGVKTTHYNTTSAILQGQTLAPTSFTSQEIWICGLPLSHAYALFLNVFLAPRIAAKVVVLQRFQLSRFCGAIQRHRATAGHIVPPIAVMLAKDPNIANFDFSSLREWRSAAAPLGQDLTDLLEERWAVPLQAWYGMTENPIIALTTCEASQKKPGATGQLAPNMEAKLVNGELLLKGPNVMAGYHNRPEVNASTFDEEGFMRTGDIVHVDEDGDLFVIDRVKELIKYKGFQVAPAEIEDLLLKHDDVADVAVIGIEDKAGATELPRAYVVLARGLDSLDTTQRTKRLFEYVAQHAAYYKKLRGGIVFIDSIPKSPSGKILRRKLRELAGDLVQTGIRS